MSEFERKLAQLRADLNTQGARVSDQLLHAVESSFDGDTEAATKVVQSDGIIDRVDVEIERACIDLLRLGANDEHGIRSVLTIVKVNNELERIADCAVDIAQSAINSEQLIKQAPPTFRVMANSVVGMGRDTNHALAEADTEMAVRVLSFDDTVCRFRKEIVLDVQHRTSGGKLNPLVAFELLAVTRSLERIADHCTNICEQVIYLETGKIVRHSIEGWATPETPEF
ncbi:MAG: phosphate signaling complex protein PhoU [Phycisphaerales bacterium]|jgi:phosphate transport system protein|nr:phosphate signaling complex protein PhoU [Phycisphaerae bacterium]MDE1037413.1 phosphate signaling complex protein PhoU [Phycisphaerales bacterium]